MTWPEAAVLIVLILGIGATVIAIAMSGLGAWPWQHKVAEDFEEEDAEG